MSTRDPAHIDAVARVLMGGGEPCEGSVSDSRAILSSTDPAVHAAMVDALTRHGVLKEQWRWSDPFDHRKPKRKKRLVTSWEVTP